MNNATIDALIARREKLTNRRDGWVDWEKIGRIDNELRTVPAGQRNDVDLLLGRMCATLEKYTTKPGWFQSQAVTLEEDSVKSLIETTQKIWREAQPIEY